jgi:hypothetical protein
VQEELQHARTLSLSVALGAVMGAAMGAATGHIYVWAAGGIAAYIAISLIGGAWKYDRSQEISQETSHEEREVRPFAVGDSQRATG